MKVLIYYSSPIIPNTGGVQNVAISISSYLIKNNIDLIYLSLDKYNISENCISHFSLPNSINVNDFTNIQYVKNLIFEKSINTCINLDGLNNHAIELMLQLKNITNIKIINVIHNTFLPQNRIYNKYFKFRFSYLYLFFYYCLKQRFYYKLDKSSGKIVLFSKSNYDDIFYLKKNSNFLKKIHYIPNPLNNISGIKHNNKQKIILFVGRLDDNQKNIKYLLKIWKSISVLFPDWKLFLLGDGPDKEILFNYSVKSNLSNIVFLGNTSPIDYYKSASFLLLTSRFEGWPMVIPESMSFGCIPCVLNSFTSSYDMILNGKNGFLLDQFNFKKNIELLIYLLNNYSNLKELRNNCIQYSKQFQIERLGIKWQELLEFKK